MRAQGPVLEAARLVLKGACGPGALGQDAPGLGAQRSAVFVSGPWTHGHGPKDAQGRNQEPGLKETRLPVHALVGLTCSPHLFGPLFAHLFGALVRGSLNKA